MANGNCYGGTITSAGKITIGERRIAMRNSEKGKVGWILLWLLGIPLPILVVFFLLRGCT